MTNGDTTINTGGGAATANVQTSGGDFVGRDQINFIVPLGNWEDVRRLLFKDPARPVTKSIQEQFQSFDWSKAEQAYLDKVIKLYDRVRILGSSADVPLGNLFTQVYILDKPTARYRHDIEELRKRGAERNEFQRQPGKQIHGLNLVKTGQNLLILGKPGAGKTTFLKYITIQAARQQLPRIPIFVSLNEWADSRWGKGDKAALLPFLVDQFDLCDFPDATLFIEYLLRAGRALLLFDGLDEVKQEKDQRRHLTRLLQDFARKYDQSQHLITCRIAASDYAFAGFADVEVADFTPEQVREYARKWFGEQAAKADAFTAELAKAENKGLAELCNTPLLLSMLCLTFDNNLRFPPSRAELYEDALETLLRKWDSSRQIQRDEIYRALSHKRKLQLLMNIALPAFQKSELFFRQRELEQSIVAYLAKLPGAPPADTLDGTIILKAMEAQHSILVERAQGIYSFSHLTFQEYLTARYLDENQGNRENDNLIRTHLTDRRWREIFLLTASLLADADGFINTLRQATNGIIATTPTLIQILVWAQERTEQAKAPGERRAAVHLAYVFLALARSLTSERDLSRPSERALSLASSLGRDLSLVRASERALDLSITRSLVRKRVRRSTRPDDNYRERAEYLALGRSRAQSLARGSAIESEIARVISRDLSSGSATPIDLASVSESAIESAIANALDSASVTTPFVGFDYGLYYAWSYALIFANIANLPWSWQAATQAFSVLVTGVAALAEEGQRTDLAQRLLGTPIPSSIADQSAWQHYADALFTILRDERDLGREWAFSDGEINKFNDYLYANELLVQCLKVAAVSDRQAILHGLLLPPQELKGEAV
ncbi:MAG: NACHT domain-containing protein [Caldilineaceae bacterium]